MSIAKNLLKNGLATGVQKLVKVLEQLVLVPFFISAWGVNYYGEWLTLTIIPSILAFSDLGFGSAAANSFVLRYAAGDKKGAADIAKTGFAIISGMIVAGTVISFVAMIIAAHYHVFDRSLITTNDAIWSVSTLILARLIAFYTQLFEAYFRAARKAALSINWVTANSIFNILTGILVLVLGYGIVTFALAQLLVSLVFIFFYGRKGAAILGLFKEVKGEIRKEEIKVITGKGLGYLMSPVWQAIYFQGTTFVVRLTLGPGAVTIFNTVRTLSRSVNQLYSMVNATVFPELQYEVGAGNVQNAHKLFRVSVLGVFLIALLGALFLWLFGSWFYQIWTHNQLQVPSAMWNIFIVGILFNAIWWTAGMVFRAVNKPYQFAVVGVIASLLAVISSYFLSKKMGIIGASLGSLVLEIVMALYVLPVSCKLLGMSVIDLLKNGKSDLLEFKKLPRRKKIAA